MARTSRAVHVEQATSRRQFSAQALGFYIIGPPSLFRCSPLSICPQPGLVCYLPLYISCPPRCASPLNSGCLLEGKQLNFPLQLCDLLLQLPLAAGRLASMQAPGRQDGCRRRNCRLLARAANAAATDLRAGTLGS